MKFTKDARTNQRIIMELAALKLESVLKLVPPTKYFWRLTGAIKLLENPPEKNDGRYKDEIIEALQADLARERTARRIVDRALSEAIARAEHWENKAHTLGHIEYAQREQLERLKKAGVIW